MASEGCDQPVPLPAREMRLGISADPARDRARLPVVADLREHAAQPDGAGGLGDRIGVTLGPGAGVDHGGEAAAQRLQGGELRREMHQLGIHALL